MNEEQDKPSFWRTLKEKLPVYMLGQRLLETFLPLWIMSVVMYFVIKKGAVPNTAKTVSFICIGILAVCVVWLFYCERQYILGVCDLTLYFGTHLVLLFILGALSFLTMLLPAYGNEGILYDIHAALFFPFKVLRYMGLSGNKVSVFAVNCAYIIISLVVPLLTHFTPQKYTSHLD
ncbi:MAG: hypothetical protein MJ078_04095 [Clostridia bacterium]|nr:hypothetical protein [Clostridia bacterium]